MTAWQESSMDIRGMNFTYRRLITSPVNPKHSASSKHIIALHGWLDNCLSFDSLAPLIDDADIIAIDLPGHGLSEHRHVSSSYAFQDYVFDLYAILQYVHDEFGWQDVTLLGHSMGSVINTLVASGYGSMVKNKLPVNIKQLINLDFFGAFVEDASQASVRLGEAMRSFRRINAMPNQHYASFDDAVKARLKKSDMQEADARLIMARNVDCQNNLYYWRFDKRLLQTSTTYFTQAQLDYVMQAITIDCLVIAGSNSRFLNDIRARVKQYQSSNFDIDLQVLEGSHYVHMEQLKACGELINQCLAK